MNYGATASQYKRAGSSLVQVALFKTRLHQRVEDREARKLEQGTPVTGQRLPLGQLGAAAL